METIPVTLIVKAPNQQIEDQTIKCELSWTIQKLKQHLSEVYPSKPPRHEQKLIYSGQLLPDTVVLKDILRQYEGQETHTVHLVCATRQNTPLKPKIPPRPPNPLLPTGEATPAPTPRPAATQPQVPQMQWPEFAPLDANQYAAQMAWMQHTYMQYMTQYMNLSANAIQNSHGRGFPRPEAPINQNQPQEAAEPADVAAQQREPENPERDWLDVFYTITRLVILLSIVYVYSSPLRFLMVACLGMAFYFYHLGFFRNLNNNNHTQNNNNMRDQQPNQEVQSPSIVNVILTFFTSFISSLIPDIPQAI